MDCVVAGIPEHGGDGRGVILFWETTDGSPEGQRERILVLFPDSENVILIRFPIQEAPIRTDASAWQANTLRSRAD